MSRVSLAPLLSLPLCVTSTKKLYSRKISHLSYSVSETPRMKKQSIRGQNFSETEQPINRVFSWEPEKIKFRKNNK